MSVDAPRPAPMADEEGIAAERWRSALESQIDPFAILELVRGADGTAVDLRYVDANPAALAYHGIPREELVGHTMLHFYPGLDANGPLKSYLATAELGIPTVLDDLPYFNEVYQEQRWYDLRAVKCGEGIALTWRDVTDRHLAAETLAESEAQFRLMASNVFGVVALSVDEIVRWISPAVKDMLGDRPDELMGRTSAHLWHPDDVETATRARDRAYAGETGMELLRVRHRDGRYRWIETALTPYDSAGGRPAPVIAMRDMTDQVAAETALHEREQLYRLLAENAMDMVLALGDDDTIQWASPSVRAVLGFAPKELVGTDVRDLIHLDDLPDLDAVADEIRSGRAQTYLFRYVTKSGQSRWMESTPRVVRDATDTATGLVVAVRDVDEQVRTRHDLQHAVEFDSLTGLAKRALALRRIKEVLDTREQSGWALLCFGVHGLTAINQAYTYAVGDEVLRAVAERLVQEAGAHDRVARIAGDEFAVLKRDIVTSTDAANAAVRILAAIRGPVIVDGHTVDVTGSVGIAMADGGDEQALLRDATAAMRQASQKGSEHWEFLDGNVGARTREALVVQSQLRQALAAGRIRPWFMPVVSLTTGELAGYEALVRWIDVDGAVRYPDEFLHIAERTGLIIDVDRVMLARTLDTAALTPAATFVLNVSAASLTSGRLAAVVQAELDRTGVDPRRIQFEVTETTLIHVSGTVMETMYSLADLGIAWWVDDFGTGFSSVSHLRDLPITGLKLDRSFTEGVSTAGSQASRLALGLAGLALGLGLDTVAEGVETVEQAEVLAAQGWHFGQGWLYGKAAPLA